MMKHFVHTGHLCLLFFLPQLTVEDQNMFGDYLCKAQNNLGTMVRVIILQEGAKPAVPTAEVRKTCL